MTSLLHRVPFQSSAQLNLSNPTQPKIVIILFLFMWVNGNINGDVSGNGNSYGNERNKPWQSVPKCFSDKKNLKICLPLYTYGVVGTSKGVLNYIEIMLLYYTLQKFLSNLLLFTIFISINH
jgi:hypothetical protein